MARKRRSREFKNSQVIDIESAREERRKKRALVNEKRIQKEKQPGEAMSRRRTIKIRRKRIVYGLVFLLIAVVIGAAIYNLISLKIEEARALKELETLNEQKAELEEELSRIDSPEYIEQQAREQLRMIMPGETLYVVNNEDEDDKEDEAEN